MRPVEDLIVHPGFTELPRALWHGLWPQHGARACGIVHVVRLEHEPLTSLSHRLKQHRERPFPAKHARNEAMRGR